MIRRFLFAVGVAAGGLLVASPAQAFAHDRVHNPYLHAMLDGLTLLLVASPAFTIGLWGSRGRWWLLALVVAVQLPVAVIGFVPIVDPMLHIAASCEALLLTAGSIWAVRRLARRDTAELAPTPTD